MDEIVKKLSQNKDISLGCFVEGKLIDSDDYLKAIDSSNNAFKNWKNNPNRSTILSKVSSVLTSKVTSFIEVASYGSYKSSNSIKDDLEYASRGFKYFSKMAKHYSTENNLVACGPIGETVLEDCAIFTVLTWFTAIPLAAGNTVVLLIKPSYSIIALCFAAILHEAGVPAGVVNVVPFVDEESFPSVAHHFPKVIGIVPEILSSCTDFHFSSVLLRKHSPSPILISKSADIQAAVNYFINLTQNHEVLWYPNVIFIEEPVYEIFTGCLRFHTMKHNKTTKKHEDDPKNSEILNNFINKQKGEGYEVLELIHRFCSCLIILNYNIALNTPVITDENKTIHHVVSLLPIRTINEGISAVNNNNGGLAISFWCNDVVEVMSIPFSLKYGTVWVNCANYFNPLIPFSSWNSFGYGTFSGKRALFENLVELASDYEVQIPSFYPANRNLIFSKENISSVIQKSIEVQTSWSKMRTDDQLSFIENISVVMDKNWNSHFKILLDQTSESEWRKAIKYLNFWADYGIEKAYQNIITISEYRVLCESEPVGIVGIMAGSATIDMLFFLIGAALIYGNSVIIGLSIDEKSSITGSVLNDLFNDKTGLVNVILNDNEELWKQFIYDKNINCIWFVKNYCKCVSKNYNLKNIAGIEARSNMTVSAKCFEIYATKEKTIWIPTLLNNK